MKPYPPASHKTSAPCILFAAMLLAMLSPFTLFAQAPTLSYAGPQTYYISGTPITPLAPNSSGVVAFAYNPNSVQLFHGTNRNPPAAIPDSSEAVDANGNIYGFVRQDVEFDEVVKIPPNGDHVDTLSKDFVFPQSIVLDASGNVFWMADYAGHYQVHGYIPSIGTDMHLEDDDEPGGMEVDGRGNVIFVNLANNTIRECVPVGGYFISPALPAGLHFDSQTGIISGTPTATSPATLYTITAYNASGSTMATVTIGVAAAAKPPTISYASPQTYYIQEKIKPLSPTSSGVAPFAYGPAVTYATGFNNPNGLAIDTAGNVYVVDAGNVALKKIPANGGPVITLNNTNLKIPRGVAVDTLGNLYVTDNQSVKEFYANGNYWQKWDNDSRAFFSTPYGIMFDEEIIVSNLTGKWFSTIHGPGQGNITIQEARPFNQVKGFAFGNLAVYFTAYGDHAVESFAQDTLVKGILPSGIAANSGHVLVSDDQGNQVLEVQETGGPPMVVGNVTSPQGLAADGVGNVFVADDGNGTVDKFAPTGGYFITPKLPFGMTFDSNTGIIGGTPLQYTTPITYTITAYNSNGSTMATVTITVAASPTLTVTASSVSSVQGQQFPPFTLTYSGFTNGDTPASLTTQPTATTTATTSSGEGIYPITVNGGVSNKYTFSYVAGTLTMASVATVEAPIPAQTYGNADFYEFGRSAPGVTFTSSNTAVATIVSGKIHITGAGTSNISATNGVRTINKPLTVNPAPLTITADDTTKVAGTVNPTLTVSYTGFVNNETNNVLSTQPTVSTTATTGSPAGMYPITASGAAAANYTITYVGGTLTVTASGGSSLTVNPAVSPNGDGINDVLTISNIEKYPDNKLTLIDRNGNTIYTATNYDNIKKVFDGHSSITGKLQNAGTYFYVLQYKDKGVLKSKTGYLVLRY